MKCILLVSLTLIGSDSFVVTPCYVSRQTARDHQHFSLNKKAQTSLGGRESRLRCGDGDIDLNKAIANARSNLAEGKSPGAGLDNAFDQADAAYADLLVTSMDDQGLELDEEEVEELAQAGMMDQESTKKRSKGILGDVMDVFDALGGGAHIVRREDGSL
ncbi:unnamed protein product [Discosporangium mesarthrocarpum]